MKSHFIYTDDPCEWYLNIVTNCSAGIQISENNIFIKMELYLLDFELSIMIAC